MAQNQNQEKQGGAAKTQDLNQLRKVRREKLANLMAEGKNPFEIVTYDQTHHTQEIKDNYEALECHGQGFICESSGPRRQHSALCLP